MKKTALRFAHNDRTYECGVEYPSERRGDGRGSGANLDGGWWWFAVTGDTQRYAPFRAAADDVAATVQDRIVAYYEGLVAHRAMPYVRSHWGRRPGQAASPAASATTPEAIETAAPPPPDVAAQ
jgi:hypothetical protein